MKRKKVMDGESREGRETMEEFDLYRDIAERTGGDIYIGVVGPVRTGKSTFIKRFSEKIVLPNILSESDRERARDELPQSGEGKTVMTTEPKFVPEKAVKVKTAGGEISVRMIDCVGYVVPGAIGIDEDGEERKVMTPWSDEPMPFGKAAETGTKKVIDEHSTIAFVVTTDGSIGEIPREAYVGAEERVIGEMKASGKPFALILNSASPEKPESVDLALSLEEKYGVPTALVNCTELDETDIAHLLEMILLEFPIREVSIEMPGWLDSLGEEHPVKQALSEAILSRADGVRTAGEVKTAFASLSEEENISACTLTRFDLGRGAAEWKLEIDPALFYATLGEMTGIGIGGEEELFSLIRSLAETKKKYDRVSAALDEAEASGYGIVTPSVDEMKLEEPEIFRQSGGYGVRLRASAPSLHIIKANIETELSPIVGSEAQSEELVKSLLCEFESDPKAIWDSNMFGKTLHELVNDGLNTKLAHMPAEARARLGDTLQRLINEGSGGLICIIL